MDGVLTEPSTREHAQGRPPVESPAGARWQWVVIALGAVVHLALSPHVASGDGAVRYQTLLDLVERGRVSPARYAIAQSILAIPLWAAGKLAGFPRDAVALFNAVVLLAGLAAAWRLLRRRVPPGWSRAFLLLVLGASMFPHHSQRFYGEVLTAVGLLLGLLLEEAGRPALGGAAIALGIVNTPAAALGAALAALDRFRSTRHMASFAGVALGVGLVAAEFMIRRGSPLDSGYAGDRGFPTFMPYSGRGGFSYPLVLGLVAQLLSFGKGILFFAPGLLLAFSRARDSVPPFLAPVQRRSLLVVAGLLLAYAKWWAWYGGQFWGPRFLLFAAFPASILLAGEVARPRRGPGWLALVLALVLLSVWVGASGSMFGLLASDLCWQDHYRLEVLCHYALEYSPLVRPFVSPPRLDGQRVALAVWFVLAGATLAWPVVRALVGPTRSLTQGTCR